MKKLLVTAAFLMLVGSPLMAEVLNVPTGPQNSLPTASYGGVSISTSFASAGNLLAFWGRGSVAWVHVSSAQHLMGSDYFIIRDTYSLTAGAVNGGASPVGPVASDDTTTNEEVYRHYSSSSDHTGGQTGTPTFGYTVYFNPPLRVKRGAAIKFNSVRQGLVTVGYTKLDNVKPSGKPD